MVDGGAEASGGRLLEVAAPRLAKHGLLPDLRNIKENGQPA